MRERELEQRFIKFLTEEKGYTQSSLMLEAPVGGFGRQQNRYIADLIIIDTDYNNYLALIEFKVAPYSVNQKTLQQVSTYLNVINQPNLPAYLVTADDDTFSIFILDNTDWRQIEPEDFPRSETLKSKNQADEKKSIKDQVEKSDAELKKGREFWRDTAFSTIASLVIGIVTSVLFFYLEFQNKDSEKARQAILIEYDSLLTADTYLIQNIQEIQNDLLLLKAQDSILLNNSKNVKIQDIERRLSLLEKVFENKPQTILKLQELTFELKATNEQITNLKEIDELRIDNLKDKIDQLTIWTSGLIITILGSITGFAINAFRKTKS